MTVFLHETLDPVREPGAHTRYLDQLGEVVRTEGNAEGSAGGRCIAAWAPVFLTGAWPQIITFWEMPGGWEGFGAHFDRSPELFHRPLERWYAERSGGFDRVLAGADYAPGLDQIEDRGLRAPVVLHETVRLAPGTSGRYLDRLGEAKQALDGRYGFDVLGGYEVAFRNGGEVIVLWTFPDVGTVSRVQARPEDYPGLRDWRRAAAELERGHVGTVVRPTDWSPLR